jgi:sugar lactone lactonase YvrE
MLKLRFGFLSLMIPVLLALATSAGAQTAHFGSSPVDRANFGASAVAADAKGDIFAAYGNQGAVVVIPAGCTIAVQIQTQCFRWIYGFNGASGVAVDAKGNVFVADSGDGTVKEILAVNGSIPASPTINKLGSGFTQPWAVAVDASDNVFVVDISKKALYKILASGGYTTVKTIATNLTNNPHGVAVDASSNIFLAGWANGAVTEYVAPGYTTVKTLGGGYQFVTPAGVAVDSAANVFVVDNQTNAAYELSKSSGYTTVVPQVTGLNGPYGLAVDGSDNLYIANSYAGNVLELVKGGWNFGTVKIGTSSALIAADAISLNFIFDSDGTLGSTAVLTQGATGLDFTDAGTGTCSAETAYTTGDICSVVVLFNPLFPGLREGAVVLRDGSENVIATGYLSGFATGPMVGFPPYKQSTLGGGFKDNAGVAIDGSGNVYVADSGDSAIKEIPLGCTAATCVKTLGGGFNVPTGVTLDGAGNVFIGDAGNNAVKEMPANCASSACVKTLGGGFSLPAQVAVDGSGTVFVSDYKNSLVKEIPVGCLTASCVKTLAAIDHPNDIAVDGSGDLFVTSANKSKVYEILAVSGSIPSSKPTIETIGSGFSYPNGVSVDSAGNVFVADSGHNAVKEILAVSGVIPASSPTILTLGSGFHWPTSVKPDSSGNLYVADYKNNRVEKLDIADPATIVFPTPTSIGSKDTTDGAEKITLENIGNTALGLSADWYNTNFILDYNTSTCFGSTSVGTSCVIGVKFAPTTGATAAYPVTTTQSIPLQGKLTAGEVGTVTTVVNSPSKTVYGQSVTLTATVAASSGKAIPTGTVQFELNSSPLGAPVALSGGTASYTTTKIAVGNYNPKAVYTPTKGSAFTTSSGTSSLTQSVISATPTVTVTPASLSVTTAQALSVKVVVSGGSGLPTPTGTVTLNYGTSAATLKNGSATFSIPAGKLPAGADTLSATYATDSASSPIYSSWVQGASLVVVSTSGSGLVTPAMTVSPSPSPVVTGATLSVKVTVKAASGKATPTGSVNLHVGTSSYTSATLSSGSATLSLNSGYLPVGTATLTLTYAPDSASSKLYYGAEAAQTLQVQKASPWVGINLSTLSVTTAQSFTATVYVGGGSGYGPSGTVTLTSGSYTSGPVALNQGGTSNAKIVIPAGSLPVGTNTLNYAYSGDNYDNAGTGSDAIVVTNPAKVTPTVLPVPTSSSITTAQSLTLKVTVPSLAGKAVPTGSVAVRSNDYSSAAVALKGGTATLVIPTGWPLTAGINTLPVLYTPDATSASTYNSSVGEFTVAVTNPANTTPVVTVTPASKSITTTQDTTVTVAVTGAKGYSSPAGTVTLICGSYTLAQQVGVGKIFIPAGTLPVGSDTLTAFFTPYSSDYPTYNTAAGSAVVTVTTGAAKATVQANGHN